MNRIGERCGVDAFFYYRWCHNSKKCRIMGLSLLIPNLFDYGQVGWIWKQVRIYQHWIFTQSTQISSRAWFWTRRMGLHRGRQMDLLDAGTCNSQHNQCTCILGSFSRRVYYFEVDISDKVNQIRLEGRYLFTLCVFVTSIAGQPCLPQMMNASSEIREGTRDNKRGKIMETRHSSSSRRPLRIQCTLQ